MIIRYSNLYARSQRSAFTLVELLVGSVITLILIAGLVSITSSMSKTWKSSEGRISAFQNSRAAFSRMADSLRLATLNSHLDYVDQAGNYRTSANQTTFTPDRLARASQLHFLAGPTAEIALGASATSNPGHALFFQAPVGQTEQADLDPLDRTLNALGYYIQYGPQDSRLMPSWLESFFGAKYRFRLLEFAQPTEDFSVYASTAKPSYNLDWLNPFSAPGSISQPRARVLAEDVVLLVALPRLAPKHEAELATKLGISDFSLADSDSRGTLLSPNFHYDSRAWQSGYPVGERVKANSDGLALAEVMRNQVPMIVDLLMVSIDANSVERFDWAAGAPPAVFQVPTDAFTDAARLEADLEAYTKQLTDANIRFHVFQTAVPIETGIWEIN